MTLSIAAKYPWGSLRNLVQLQRNLPKAIIFVTDSRWTRYYPYNEHDFEDVGTKFFALTNDAGAVYAGDVISAEHCIKELRKKLAGGRKRSFKHSMYIAQQTFQDTYRHHKQRRKTKVFPLWFLIGVCDKVGNASLMYFASPKFNPMFIEGVYGVGVKEACRELENTVNQKIEERVKDELDSYFRYPILQSMPELKVNNDAWHIGMLIAGIVHQQVIGSDDYSTIGGPIQFAIVDREGINMPGLSWTKNPLRGGDPWIRATAEPGEITTYQERYKLGPAFMDSSSFGLYRIDA